MKQAWFFYENGFKLPRLMETNRRERQTGPLYGTMEPPRPSPLVPPGSHYECQEESLHSYGTWQIHTSLEGVGGGESTAAQDSSGAWRR